MFIRWRCRCRCRCDSRKKPFVLFYADKWQIPHVIITTLSVMTVRQHPDIVTVWSLAEWCGDYDHSNNNRNEMLEKRRFNEFD